MENYSLTHVSLMKVPTISDWTSPFRFKGCWVVFVIFVQILIVHSASKQWSGSALFAYVP